MAVDNAGAITEWPRTLLWAFFDTIDGAAKALSGLQAKVDTNPNLITVENTAVIEKDAEGKVSYSEREDLSGMKGLANGLMIGGLVGALTPGTSMFTMAGTAGKWSALGGRLHDAGFEDNDLEAAAENMPNNSSALLIDVTNRWLDDLVRTLNQAAYRVGYAELSETVGKILEAEGRAAKS